MLDGIGNFEPGWPDCCPMPKKLDTGRQQAANNKLQCNKTATKQQTH
jgi:hypothetical protein